MRNFYPYKSLRSPDKEIKGGADRDLALFLWVVTRKKEGKDGPITNGSTVSPLLKPKD